MRPKNKIKPPGAYVGSVQKRRPRAFESRQPSGRGKYENYPRDLGRLIPLPASTSPGQRSRCRVYTSARTRAARQLTTCRLVPPGAPIRLSLFGNNLPRQGIPTRTILGFPETCWPAGRCFGSGGDTTSDDLKR